MGARDDPKGSHLLVQQLLLFLMILLPMMILIGAAERTTARASVWFWILLLLPFVLLPWFWRSAARQAPADSADTPPQPVPADPRVTDAAADVVDVERASAANGISILEGRLRTDATAAFARLEQRLAPQDLRPLLEDWGDGRVRLTALPQAAQQAIQASTFPTVNVVLLLATVVTTVWAGALHQGVNLLQEPSRFAAGLPYALALLAILGVHELGHYVVARWHGVDVTLPYFIPVPMGLGTFGAFIQMKSLIRSRRAVFDIGIAGPLAGLLVAMPALYFGLRGAAPIEDGTHTMGMHAGSSVLLAVIYQLANGGGLGDAVVQLSPIAFAGWIGLFITALNLLPVGQLDGGHIAYGLFGRRHARAIGIGTFFVMLGLGLTVWPGLLTWALLLALLAGFSHMPALNDVTPPDGRRFALGAVALALLILIVMPLPGAARGLMLDCPYL